MKSLACYTSFSFAYLDRASVLATSFKKYNPSYDVIAVINDVPKSGFDEDRLSCFDEVIYADALIGEGFRTWCFKHDVVELSTAVKGAALSALLRRGYEKVLYIDPDIMVFSSFRLVEEILEASNVVLTPHQLGYNDESLSIVDNEIGSLKFGIYNLGFIGVANSEEGVRFADWWDKRLRLFCYDDVPNGLFTDQRWCDHVPVFFEGVHILKNPGFNVASWNISTRRLSFGEDELLVNGTPLVFFHFTKFNGIGAAMISRHAKDNMEVYEVWELYRRSLAAFPNEDHKGYWFYGSYASGRKITKPERLLFRSRGDLQDFFVDPFDDSGNSLIGYLELNGLLAGVPKD